MAYNKFPAVDDNNQFPSVIRQALATCSELISAFASKATETAYNLHAANRNNPHSVTKAQVGLSDVDNTSDINKPVSSAQQLAINTLQTSLDKQAKNRVYYSKIITVTGYTTSRSVVNNIPSFTFKANRRYRIMWESDFLISQPPGTGALYISTCSTADAASSISGLTDIRGMNAVATGTASTSQRIIAYYEPTVDTTVQIKFSMQIDGTAGGSIATQGNRPGGTVYSIWDDGAV